MRILLTEQEREVLRNSGSGATRGEQVQNRTALEGEVVGEKIDRAIWTVMKKNPDAFQMSTVDFYFKKFHKEDIANGTV